MAQASSEPRRQPRGATSGPRDVDLHARPAADFVRPRWASPPTCRWPPVEREVDAKSLLSVLALGAKGGTELRLTASGQDAAAALDALSALHRDAQRLTSGSRRGGSTSAALRSPRARRCGEPLGLAVVERAHPGTHRSHARCPSTQLVRPEAHEQRDHQRVRCRLSADLERNTGRRAPPGRWWRCERSTRGSWAGASPCAKRSVPSVAWVRSFVPMLRKSDTAAISAAASAASGSSIIAPSSTSAPSAGEDRASHAHLAGRSDHREQDAHVATAGELRDRDELGAERPGVGQQQLDAAARLVAQERRDLVAAEVEDPYGGGAAVQPGEQRGEHLHVLRSLGPGRRIQEGELGPDQARALRPCGQAGAELCGRRGVHEHANAVSVGGLGRQGAVGDLARARARTIVRGRARELAHARRTARGSPCPRCRLRRPTFRRPTWSSSGPASTVMGMPSERATIAACAVTPPPERAMPASRSPCSATSAGPRSSATRTNAEPLASTASSGAPAAMRAARRPERANVIGPRRQQGVRQRGDHGGVLLGRLDHGRSRAQAALRHGLGHR